MKKLTLMAALAISAVTFNPIEASAAVNVNANSAVIGAEVTEMDFWSRLRDSILEDSRNDDSYESGYSDRRGGYDDGYSDRRGGYDDSGPRHRQRRQPPPPPPRRGHRPPPPPHHRW